MKRIGICVGCFSTQTLTRHHIIPQRYHSLGLASQHLVVELCRACHDEVDGITHMPRNIRYQRKRARRKVKMANLKKIKQALIPQDRIRKAIIDDYYWKLSWENRTWDIGKHDADQLWKR